MDITIASHARLPIPSTLRQRAVAKAQSALQRLGHMVQRLDIRLPDVNGPKGGVCKRCVAVLRLANGGTITIEQRHENIGAAVMNAISRMRGQLAKLTDRRVEQRNQRTTAAGTGPR